METCVHCDKSGISSLNGHRRNCKRWKETRNRPPSSQTRDKRENWRKNESVRKRQRNNATTDLQDGSGYNDGSGSSLVSDVFYFIFTQSNRNIRMLLHRDHQVLLTQLRICIIQNKIIQCMT